MESYSRDVEEFFRSLGGKTAIAEISSLHVQKYVASLYLANSSASVARKMSSLRAFFRHCLWQKLLTTDPLAGLAGPKLAKHIPVFLTVDEVLSLLEAAKENGQSLATRPSGDGADLYNWNAGF